MDKLLTFTLIVLFSCSLMGAYRLNHEAINQPASFGATVPLATASFETSLQSAITSSATTMTLTANAVRGGGSLTGYTCFTLDEGSAQAETVCGTVSGTTVSGLTRGISQSTGTTTVAALQFAHRRGANVKITDFPILQILKAQNNGEDTYPNLMNYTYSPSYIGASTTAIVSKGYVDGVALVSAPNADDTTKGVVETATAAEAAAGTSLGGSGARLAVPASICNATWSAATLCVMTSAGGKIAQGFLDLTATFTWTALHTFTGGVTSTGTTTVSASSLVTNPFVINTLAYKFPNTRGAANTVLTENGSGTLSWSTSPVTALINTPNPTLSTSNSASTTLASVTVPANTINTTDTIMRISGSFYSVTGACYGSIQYGNGTSSTTVGYTGVGSNGAYNMVDVTLIATSSVTEVASYASTGNGAGSNVVATGWSFPSYNIAAQTYVSFIGYCTSGGPVNLYLEAVHAVK